MFFLVCRLSSGQKLPIGKNTAQELPIGASHGSIDGLKFN